MGSIITAHFALFLVLDYQLSKTTAGIGFALVQYCAENVKEEKIGMAMGFASLFMRAGMLVAPPIFGYIADLKGTYESSWLSLGIIIFIASIGQYISLKKL